MPVAATTETFITIFADLGVLLPFTSDIEQQPPAMETINQVGQIVNKRRASGQSTTVFCVGDISYAR